MCIWQSAALAGAFTLAGPVPVVFGTACWGRPAVASSVPVTAAAAAAVKNVRRPMVGSLIDVPPVMLLPGPASVLESDRGDRSGRAPQKSAASPLYSRRPIRYAA